MKDALITIALPIAISFFLPFNVIAAIQSTETIQDEIDNAAAGDVVFVPAGEYRGAVVLKNGVTLAGSGEWETIIDGTDVDVVIKGAPDAIISNLTIICGSVGVETRGSFMGIFDCAFHGYDSIAIHVGGGSAVIVNNIIENGSISCNSSNPLIICNTIVTTGTDGLWSWYGPGPTAINNLIVGANHGVHAGAGSAPTLDNNAFWANGTTFQGCGPDINGIHADPLFIDPEGGDFRLSPPSPLAGAGKIIEELWNGEKPDAGWNSERRCDIEDCRAFMELAAPDLVPDTPVVVYTLDKTDGEFLVTTGHAVSRFTVRSSTTNTPITDIEAFDEKDKIRLIADLVENEYPQVEVQSEEPAMEAPDSRYVLRNTYHSPESYYDDDNGSRIFRRKTSFPNVVIEIPEGYIAIRAVKNGVAIDGDLPDVIEISSPGIKEIEVVMKRTSMLPTECK